MDSAQKSQGAGLMVPIANGGAVPSDMKKQSKRRRESYRLPDSLCNGCVRRNRLLVTGRGVMGCMPTGAHLLCVALSTWTIWNPNGDDRLQGEGSYVSYQYCRNLFVDWRARPQQS